jgi:OOP family OmpA-OmpF porin
VPAASPRAAPAPASAPTGDIGAAIEAEGHASLDDLGFASGKGALEPGDYASLRSLAAWLIAHPDMTVVLVGHTDATGGLAVNVALSKARAAAVRQALIAAGVPGGQVAAEGVGYLAPRASNLTPEGQAQNRRVEVVLTSTQLSSVTRNP